MHISVGWKHTSINCFRGVFTRVRTTHSATGACCYLFEKVIKVLLYWDRHGTIVLYLKKIFIVKSQLPSVLSQITSLECRNELLARHQHQQQHHSRDCQDADTEKRCMLLFLCQWRRQPKLCDMAATPPRRRSKQSWKILAKRGEMMDDKKSFRF